MPRGSRRVESPRASAGSPDVMVVAVFRYWRAGSSSAVITKPVVPAPPWVCLSTLIAPVGTNVFSNTHAAPWVLVMVTETAVGGAPIRRRCSVALQL